MVSVGPKERKERSRVMDVHAISCILLKHKIIRKLFISSFILNILHTLMGPDFSSIATELLGTIGKGNRDASEL